MEHERLAKVETHVEWLVGTIAKMEPKVNMLVEWRWKMWGVTAAISVICTGILELMVAIIKH